MAVRKPRVTKPPKRKVAGQPAQTLWTDLADIGRRIPDAELQRLPKDLARNFDHYAHGSSRE
jgi:hypothetical protein